MPSSYICWWEWEATAEEKAAKERAKAEARVANPRTSQFDGPCMDCCTPLAACCVSADGRKLYGRVPTAYEDGGSILPRDYFLPLCLHTCLCPQQGGQPCPTRAGDLGDACCANVFANTCLCCIQTREASQNNIRP